MKKLAIASLVILFTTTVFAVVPARDGPPEIVFEDVEQPINDADLINTVDGQWSSWSVFSSCTQSCGGGSKYRIKTRKCNNPTPANGGKECSGSDEEMEVCNIRNNDLAVDGQWSCWSRWSSCTKSCGRGSKQRTRQCNNPTPAKGGQPCCGSGKEMLPCNSGSCDKNCKNDSDDEICQSIADVVYGNCHSYGDVCKKACNLCNVNCKCGIRNKQRIIGGEEVSPNRKYPWQVGLKVAAPNNFVHCGGSIINDRWILSAANCIISFDKLCKSSLYTIKVLVGEHKLLDKSDDVSDKKEYSTEKIVPHPNFDCTTFDYDFALLKLTESIRFNNIISPICLPEGANKDYVGKDATATGWGWTSFPNGKMSPYLKEVQLTILDNDKCGKRTKRPASMMCAHGQPDKAQPEKAPCTGDIGGPLTVIEGNRYIQVGVVSYYNGPKGCYDTDYPFVYARVTTALPWITLTTLDGKKCR